MTAVQLREALLATLGFEPQGEPAGNVSVGRGSLDGRAVCVAAVENRGASGAIGSVEAQRLVAALRIAAAERAAVVLWLDSAGAKVSEGLGALGAFRALYHAGLAAVLERVPVAAVLGRNCFGGSSMLAHLATRRLLAPESQLAMSGPAVIASASGLDPLDEMFRAMAEATLSAPARAKASPANTVWTEGFDLAAWLREALAARPDPVAEFRSRHEALAARLGDRARAGTWETVRRRDLEKLYAAGYEARECEGVLEGEGRRGDGVERFLGLVGKAPLTAARAWRFSEAAWRQLQAPPARLQAYLDCASHAARLDEEKLVLTEYIVDMGAALAALGARGTAVGMTVAGKAGGGVYVALAAPAREVSSLYGADIQVLPGSAVAAILGASRESAPSFDEYRKAGVAESEIKLGLVPGT